MLKFSEAAIAATRQGQGRSSGSEADFAVSQLEPRVLLSASGTGWTDPTDETLTAQEETAGAPIVSFSMAWDEPIATPTDLTATTLSSTSIQLTWSDNSHNETGFGIYRWISGRFRLIAEVGANVTEYVDVNLTPGSTYLYRVYAYNDFNASEMSETATGTTVPLAPSYLSATAVSASEIELSWGWSAGAEGYRIERSLDGSTGWMLVGQTDSFTLELTDAGLAGGTTYHYRVMAVNAGGLSAPSEVAVATTEQSAVAGPAAPTCVKASVFGHKHVRVTWEPVEGATGYLIERSDNGGAWAQVAVVGTELPEYKDHWVSADGSHTYRLRTITDTGMSAPSDEVTVTTGRPLIMTAAVSGKRFSSEPIGLLGDDDDLVTGLVLGKGGK